VHRASENTRANIWWQQTFFSFHSQSYFLQSTLSYIGTQNLFFWRPIHGMSAPLVMCLPKKLLACGFSTPHTLFRPRTHDLYHELITQLLFDFRQFERAGVDFRWVSVDGFDIYWIPKRFSCGIGRQKTQEHIQDGSRYSSHTLIYFLQSIISYIGN